MTLSEFLRMAREKLESNQQKPCSNEPSSRAENGLLELVWENGQIVMRDQPTKVNKNHSNLQNMASNTPRIRDLILLHNTKIGKSSEVESIWDDIPSGHLDSRQDDNTTRWFNYAIDDPLPRDYCSGLIPEEISGFTTTQETILSVEKRTSCYKTIGCLQVGGNNTLKGSSSSSKPPLASRQNVQQLPANKTDLLNFSRFSKPAFLTKSNAPPSSNIAPNVPPSSCVGKTRFTENPGKSAVNEQSRNVAMVNSKQVTVKETKDLRSIDRRDNDICMKSRCARNVKKTEADAYSRKEVPRENNNENITEDVVVASSVGSGNNAHGVSCDQTRHSKRKFPDSDESEYRSDEVETESVRAKKKTNGRAGNGSKRNRAAEVHNLSERRRRDRINEKMRALQELIPSCNKADKASMLDEAIEYLKSLQLQVQIMSMGAGLCLPPMSMMYPHFRPPLMGMMGLGFAFDNMMMHGPQIPPLMPGGPRIPLPCSDIGIPCSVLPSPHHATALHVNPTVMNESSQSMNCLTDQLQQQVMINELRYDQKTDSVHTTSISNLTSPSTELKEVGDLNRS